MEIPMQSEVGSSDFRPQERPATGGGIDRSRALLVSVALLAAAAVLMVAGKRGLFDGAANVIADLAGLVLAISGASYLIYIWWSERFRISIGRLMVIVAIMAILLQGFLVWVRSMSQPPIAASAPAK
jgi:hypothetical protein